MIYLAIALSGILLVLLVAVAASGWAGRVWYSWRRSRHVAAAVPVPEYRFVDPYGSMVLAEERDWRPHYEPRLGRVIDDPAECWPDWREQTAADLSPEALGSEYDPDDALMTSTDDSGPGDSLAGAPGPVQRLCGPEQPHEKPAGTESAGSGLTRLADTADVMDARLLADVAAELRAQDDDAALYLSRFRSACAQARLDLQAALA